MDNKNKKGQKQGGESMLYQYHCACCETVVASTDKDCPNCGSHNIRSPFGFWIFCIVACLAAAIIVKSVQVYLADRNSEPAAVTSLFDVLNHDNKPK